MRTEIISLPSLNVGDIVRAYGFVAKVVEKRDYPLTVDGVTYGDADRPCSQIDLELIEADDEHSRRDFRFLCQGHKGKPNLALLQGNERYRITRIVE